MNIKIIGAGVAGLTCARELLDHGFSVEIYDRASKLGGDSCSWFAGGMLAPWCERESAEQAVVDLGANAASWWAKHVDGVKQNGSLVLSMQRDKRDLDRFARLTQNHGLVDNETIAHLEPDLAGRFQRGLFFKDEAHLDPRMVLHDLLESIITDGAKVFFNEAVSSADFPDARVVDCRGFAARNELDTLRGVKGEMLILHSEEIRFQRAIRLVHPRFPLYLVPRENGDMMIGATMIENDERARISARSMLELLSAAYAIHPALGEAEIIETGVDVRPAFPDNLPAVVRKGENLYVNGMFRHGFLLSPAMAKQVAGALQDDAIFAELKECA
ncbi:MAG: glycine oxidase ThiO [Pseudomonadota bacterium]